MTQLHTPLLVAHVLVAVLGLGSITAVAILSRTARRIGLDSTAALPWCAPLLRFAALSLAALLVTGFLLDVSTGGAFAKTWWLRGSALLLVVAGVLQAWARRAVRRGLGSIHDAKPVLREVERISYGTCALITIIVGLMLVKPF